MTYSNFIIEKEKLNLSFAQFAKIIGYTPDAIKKWKHKDNVPKWVGIVIKYIKISNTINENII
jgi:DNA-binding transcriptional regulator YiaG